MVTNMQAQLLLLSQKYDLLERSYTNLIEEKECLATATSQCSAKPERRRLQHDSELLRQIYDKIMED